MAKAPCPGRGVCLLTGTKTHCKNEAGSRVGGWLAGRVAARLHAVQRHAVFIWLPELADPTMQRGNDVGNARRRALMVEAKVWFRRQLVAMYLHFIGIHHLCEHGPLAQDPHAPRRSSSSTNISASSRVGVGSQSKAWMCRASRGGHGLVLDGSG